MTAVLCYEAGFAVGIVHGVALDKAPSARRGVLLRMLLCYLRLRRVELSPRPCNEPDKFGV